MIYAGIRTGLKRLTENHSSAVNHPPPILENPTLIDWVFSARSASVGAVPGACGSARATGSTVHCSNLLSAATLCEQRLHLLDCVGRIGQVNNSVTVRTNGTQVLNGIDLVFLSNVAELAKVMHMDEALCGLAVAFVEVHAAGSAVVTIELKASGPCDWVPLVRVY